MVWYQEWVLVIDPVVLRTNYVVFTVVFPHIPLLIISVKQCLQVVVWSIGAGFYLHSFYRVAVVDRCNGSIKIVIRFVAGLFPTRWTNVGCFHDVWDCSMARNTLSLLGVSFLVY